MQTSSKSAKELMRISRGQLIGKYGVSIATIILIGLIQAVAMSIVTSITEISNATTYIIDILITLIIEVLAGVLVFGQCNFFLRLVRGSSVDIKDVFAGFKTSVDKALAIQAILSIPLAIALIGRAVIEMNAIPIAGIYVNLGMLLFRDLANIVLSLYLGLSFFILIDHPEMSVQEILTESVRLMQNKKGRLIMIYLSILPLMILGVLSFGIGLLYSNVFLMTSRANFYLDVIGEEPNCPYAEKPQSEATVFTMPADDSDSTI